MKTHIRPPPSDLEAVLSLEKRLVFPRFNADVAFYLGTKIRDFLHVERSAPAVVSVSSVNSNQLLYHACSHPGTTPDNDIWVARKRATVLRWGVSSYAMHKKFNGSEKAFAEKFALGLGAGEYAIHGEGVPVRVQRFDGLVAVVVVSGLAQQEDHMVVIEGFERCIAGMEDGK